MSGLSRVEKIRLVDRRLKSHRIEVGSTDLVAARFQNHCCPIFQCGSGGLRLEWA